MGNTIIFMTNAKVASDCMDDKFWFEMIQLVWSKWTVIRNFFSVSPDDLLLRMGEYDLGSTKEPQGHADRKVQIVKSHPKFGSKYPVEKV